MGKARLQVYSSDSSSDELSSGEESYTIDYGRYQAACLAEGLQSRQNRLAALRELQEVVSQGYASASKKVQAAVFEDLLVAVHQLDSRQKVYEATTSLVAAAKRALPQQKRNQLLKEQKQAAVATKRAARRQAGESEDDTSDDGLSAAVLGDVPVEVVRGILQALDPLSLAAAACVCRSWHRLATSDDLWLQHLQLVFPGLGRKQQHQQRQRGPKQQLCNSNPHADAQQDTRLSATSEADLPAASDRTADHMQPCARNDSSGTARGHQPHHPGAYLRFRQAALCHPSMLLPWRSCRALLCGRLQWLPPGHPQAPRAAAAARAARRGVVTPGPIYVTCDQAVSWMMGKPWSDVLRDSANNSSKSGTDSDCGSGSGSSSDGDESHTGRKSLRLWAI